MTCRKCIHFVVCSKDEQTRYYGMEIACDNVEELCQHFQDKSALEKQIPKKPQKIISNKIGIKYKCPNCDKTFMRIDENNIQWGHIPKFCDICGQAVE